MNPSNEISGLIDLFSLERFYFKINGTFFNLTYVSISIHYGMQFVVDLYAPTYQGEFKFIRHL